MSPVVRFFNKYLGWRNWSVLTYNSVIENVFLFFYIAFLKGLSGSIFLFDFFAFFLFSAFSTTYGYLINDLADKELDKKHEKANSFEEDSPAKALLIVVFFFLLSVVFAVFFIRRPLFLWLWLSWVLLATFYSIRPVRLKERGKVGLFFVVIAQRVLPTVIIFSAFQYFGPIDVVLFTIYIFFRGLSSDLNHQLDDYQRDSRTGTRTYTVDAGFQKAKTVFHISLETERALLLVCLFCMYLKLPMPEIHGVSLFLPIVAAYVVLYALTWLQTTRQGINNINPFDHSSRNAFHFIHHTFPSVILPVYLLLFLVWRDWVFFLPLLFLVIYRRLYSVELIRKGLSSLIPR